MKYVIDSSMAVKWALPEADSAQPVAVYDPNRRLSFKNRFHFTKRRFVSGG